MEIQRNILSGLNGNRTLVDASEMGADSMERLHGRLQNYRRVLDILDGIRSRPNARDEYLRITSTITRVKEEIKNLRVSLEETLHLTDTNRRRVESLKKLKSRMQRIIDNPQYFNNQNPEESLQTPYPLNSSTPSPQLLKSHIPTPNFKLSPVKPVEKESHAPSNPPAPYQVIPNGNKNGTPKPLKDLEVAISYITHDEFTKIPQYMKGRITYDEINSFVEIYNAVLNKKQSLIKKPKKLLKTKREQDLVIEWKAETNSELTNKYFLSAKDFDSLNSYKLSKKDYSIFVILRHLMRVKEERHKKSVFYVALF